MNKFFSSYISISSLIVYLLFDSHVAIAQIIPDRTTPTTVNTEGNRLVIDRGDRAGTNLFHSFEQFSISSGKEAWFNNAVDIENIFSRITGGNISYINGLIRTNGDANLFLINPAGIIFGEGASLDIGGSFYGSTAESILFPDNVEFKATDNQTKPLLTINQPIGLNLGNNPGDIINRSLVKNSADEKVGLEVSNTKNLNLVGGNINLEGGILTASGGNIQLGGLSAAGIVGISADGSLSFPQEITKENVSLTHGALVNVVDTGGGAININAQNLELSQGSRLIAGIDKEVNSSTAQAGDIKLNVEEAVIINGPESGIFNNVGEENILEDEGEEDYTSSFNAVGNAGKISIEAGSLSITSGGRIGSTIFGQGNAGDVTVNARENIEIQGFDNAPDVNSEYPTGIFSNLEVGAKGNSGIIKISSDSFILANRAQLRTSIGQGAEGIAGKILVSTGSLTLNDAGTRLATSVRREGKGTGGDIEIEAETMTINPGSTLLTELGPDAVGEAGNIEIKTGSLILNSPSLKEDSSSADRSLIETSVFDRAQGNGGNIEIQTNSLSLRGEAFLASEIREEAQGNAGNIFIDTGSLTLDKDSTIQSITEAMTIGNAGNIEINAHTVEIHEGSTILSTTKGEGNAGKIEVNASDSVVISGISDFLYLDRILRDEMTGEIVRRNPIAEGGSSGLYTSVEEKASGQGGDIVISTPNLKILDGGVVSAEVESTAQGQGGDIFIDAIQLELGDGGQIIADGLGIGDAGKITLNIKDSIRVFGSDPTFSERFKAEKRTRESIGRNSEEITVNGRLTEQEGRENFTQVGIGDDRQISSVFANSENQGSGGIINIQTGTLTLEDGGQIAAATSAGEGGNIILRIDDTLSMRNSSLISAQATGDADGGNIDITTKFVVAFPNEIFSNGNDVIANGLVGQGGNINISAQQIFGLAERKATANNVTNDIDASSEFGFDGNISIDTPEIDPSRGLTKLPIKFISPKPLQSCHRQKRQDSFINIGRGGLPDNPDKINSNNTWEDLRSVDNGFRNSSGRTIKDVAVNAKSKPKQIVEAQGWRVNSQGNVVLTAQPFTSSSQNEAIKYTTCYIFG
ncbi:filamentous hemagglutinin N-terminal domain-containing protein [Pleurocapsa sp. PCC 7319]|uniref:two-partner secretion domain-containing protein n=1 Tax=Pleurocapsa sp. PCC 7319 TaxID=118161 RepID=UPI000346734A|nr:filamentous hemagglutinin N-terminal domain-containing protein [Pleurocapsa sp. PCC 7319]